MLHTNALCQPGRLAGHSRMGTGCPHCLCAVTRLRGWQRWLWPALRLLLREGGWAFPILGGQRLWVLFCEVESQWGLGRSFAIARGPLLCMVGGRRGARIYGPWGLALAKGLVLAQRISPAPSHRGGAEPRPSPHHSRSGGGPTGLEGLRGGINERAGAPSVRAAARSANGLRPRSPQPMNGASFSSGSQ